jgi:tetratricopeptide (TPR) repeat protein
MTPMAKKRTRLKQTTSMTMTTAMTSPSTTRAEVTLRRAGAFGVVVISAIAAAANPKATALAREAESLYQDAKFTEAARALKSAYDLEPQAQFLFNMARALELAGQTGEAIETYQRYIVLPADETEVALVARAKATIETRTRPAQSVAAPTTSARSSGGKPKQKSEPGGDIESAVVAPLPGAAPSPKLPALLVTGVSAVALAVGVGFGVLAQSARFDFDHATTLQGKLSLQTTARTQALVADVCLAAGAVAAVTAVVLLLKSDEAPLAVAFAPIRQGGLLALGLRF